MRYDAFPGPGRFFKGCLHSHSTRSDGRLSPADLLSLYRRLGYDFMALTDHNVFNRESYGMNDDFVILPAMETHTLYADMDEHHKCHHFVVLARGDGGMVHDQQAGNDRFTHPTQVQATIDRLKADDNLIMLCHPYWSKTTLLDYGSLTGLFAMEVFNTGCHCEDNTGLSYTQWDDMLRTGARLFAVAVDDAHRMEHIGGGWVQVYAPELNRTALLNALEQGRFYASTGPEIHGLTVEDGELTVHCSPCRRICCLSDRIGGRCEIPSRNGTLVEARFPIHPNDRYVRVECIEDENRMAWSQPVWMDVLQK